MFCLQSILYVILSSACVTGALLGGALGTIPRVGCVRRWSSRSAPFTFLTYNMKAQGEREVISLHEEFRSPHS